MALSGKTRKSDHTKVSRYTVYNIYVRLLLLQLYHYDCLTNFITGSAQYTKYLFVKRKGVFESHTHSYLVNTISILLQEVHNL